MVTCKTRRTLLATYTRSVGLYTNAARNIVGLLGADFSLAFERTGGLRRKCKEADDASMERWRQDYAQKLGGLHSFSGNFHKPSLFNRAPWASRRFPATNEIDLAPFFGDVPGIR